MERLVTNFLRFVSGQSDDRTEFHVNRIAQGHSHDRALAAFKADQARIASKQDGATFSTKRSATKQS